jgi:hypothetical protein
MHDEYIQQIKITSESNDQNRKTKTQLNRDKLVEISATNNHQIRTCQSQTATHFQITSNFHREIEEERIRTVQRPKEEVYQIELSLKQQQNNLDQKIQQINSIREPITKVLPYRI